MVSNTIQYINIDKGDYMSEKKSKAQRVMVTEEDMGDHTKIAIPSEIGNHFVGLGARFGVYR